MSKEKSSNGKANYSVIIMTALIVGVITFVSGKISTPSDVNKEDIEANEEGIKTEIVDRKTGDIDLDNKINLLETNKVGVQVFKQYEQRMDDRHILDATIQQTRHNSISTRLDDLFELIKTRENDNQ